MGDSRQPLTNSENSVSPVKRVIVLRWGHRLQRDARLTSHVALTARALGASGFVLSDVTDQKLELTIEKITTTWGGEFSFEMGTAWKRTVLDWKASGGIVVHLTAYGENIQSSDVLQRIKASAEDVLIIVGSQKVPSEFYSSDVSDFNVAVGNQPHSECAALAIFMDRFFEGKALEKTFNNARLRIVPQKRGKRII